MFIRKKNRLPNKSLYEANHWYFVTLCVQERECIFGDIVESVTDGHNNYRLQLNDLGLIIETTWNDLPVMFHNIILDAYVVMPNHFHGIIGFEGMPISSFTQKATDLGKIIKRFKLETGFRTKAISEYFVGGTFRQKSFYDHIVRDQSDLERIQEYIFNNPLKREQDIFNKVNDTDYRKKYHS